MRRRTRGAQYVGTFADLLRVAGLCGAMLAAPLALRAQSVVADANLSSDDRRAADELLSRPVTLDLDHATLKRALDAATASAKVLVQYQTQVLRAYDKIVTVHLVKVPLRTALDTILAGTSLRVVPDGQTQLVVVDQSALLRQVTTGVIQGTVSDSATGHRVAHASVTVIGTELATVTDQHGEFVLRNVPSGERMMVVKLLGYAPIRRPVVVSERDTVSLRIVLSPMPTVLSGVVTTATGIRRRVEVGNDIARLDVDAILRVTPATNVSQLLADRVPGLVVTNTTGIPGAPTRIRLRGSSSVELSDDPIVIVDGVRVYSNQSGSSTNGTVNTTGGGTGIGARAGPAGTSSQYEGPSALDQIDPNSIATIEVMKGPSASALYGSDAANGVIVITTKKGAPGVTRWNAVFKGGRATLSGDWPINYFRFGHALGINNSGSVVCSPFDGDVACSLDSVVAFQALNSSRYSPLGSGLSDGVSASVSGGNGALTYSLTGSADNQGGYLHLPDVEAQRFEKFHGFAAPGWMKNPDTYGTVGGTSQVTAQLGQSAVSISLTSSIFKSAQQQSSLQGALAQLQGEYIDTTQLARGGPLVNEYYERAQLDALTFTNAVTLNGWSPFRWLPITATAGLNLGNNSNNSVTPRDYILGNPDSLGTYWMTHGTNSVVTLNVGTTIQTGFLHTALGVNVTGASSSTYSSDTHGLPIGVMSPTTFTCGANAICGSQYASAATTYGWYLQPTLEFLSRLFISPGFRLDGGTASGNNAQLTLFPKVDVSYLMFDRPDQPMWGVLSSLRPRLAFGIAGVQPDPGSFERLWLQGTVIPVGSSTPVDIAPLVSVGNTKLQPERSRELEGGLDADLWGDRMTLRLTGYQKVRYDAILDVPLAGSVGYGEGEAFIKKNIGEIRNTGFEGDASLRLFDRPSFSWNVDGNIGTNSNRVMSLVAGQETIVMSAGLGYASLITPGYALDGIWVRPILSFADVNQDHLIEPNEVRVGDSLMYVGAPGPRYEAALNTALSFFNGRFSVNTGIDYRNGITQINAVLPLLLQVNNPASSPSEQAAVAAQQITSYGLIQTVNVLRWSSLAVTYLAPVRVAQLFHASSMSVSLQGSNLGLKTSYRGKDPDVNAFSTGNQIADTGELPMPMTWNLRITLGN